MARLGFASYGYLSQTPRNGAGTESRYCGHPPQPEGELIQATAGQKKAPKARTRAGEGRLLIEVVVGVSQLSKRAESAQLPFNFAGGSDDAALTI